MFKNYTKRAVDLYFIIKQNGIIFECTLHSQKVRRAEHIVGGECLTTVAKNEISRCCQFFLLLDFSQLCFRHSR